MEVRFVRAFQWHRRGEVVDVAPSVAKLWVLMGHAELAGSAGGVVETAENRAVPETAMAAPVGKRTRRRNRGHAVSNADSAGDA